MSYVSDTISGGYTQSSYVYFHTNPSRNALGFVGGNDVSQISGNLVDLESDLHGLTRDLSNDPSKKFQGLLNAGNLKQTLLFTTQQSNKQIVFVERSTGEVRTIPTDLRHLSTTQYVSYPGVPAPDPIRQEVFGFPWRF